MRRTTLTGPVLAAMLLLGCTNEEPRKPDPPLRWSSERADPVADALGVWRLGAAYFPESAGGLRLDPPEPYRIDAWTATFLRKPWCIPAVQFGCTPSVGGDRYLHRALDPLKSMSSVSRLHALTVLMKAGAPLSVPEQWQALHKLRERHPEWKAVLDELATAFESDRIMEALSQAPSDDWHDPALSLCWAMRAAAVTGLREALPRIAELSTVHVLDVSLTAELSLESFAGEEGDRALATCVRGWQYDAFERAARALRKRNPDLLLATLRSMGRPARSAYFYALFRGWCNDPDAVPILCEEVGSCAIIDGELFEHIERLAGPEHREIVNRLPELVRPKQRERAEAVVKAVKARLIEGR